jgi:hypothetical protein
MAKGPRVPSIKMASLFFCVPFFCFSEIKNHLLSIRELVNRIKEHEKEKLLDLISTLEHLENEK